MENSHNFKENYPGKNNTNLDLKDNKQQIKKVSGLPIFRSRKEVGRVVQL